MGEKNVWMDVAIFATPFVRSRWLLDAELSNSLENNIVHRNAERKLREHMHYEEWFPYGRQHDCALLALYVIVGEVCDVNRVS